MKELFLDIVNHTELNGAERQLRVFIESCYESKIEEFIEAINNWLPIVNSFVDKTFSNGFTEGLNNKIKVVKRIGFGYKNFSFFRFFIFTGRYFFWIFTI